MAVKQNRVDHEARINELHAQLDERLTELTTSDDWLAYLTTARKFHRYSPQNQMLLAVQGAEGYVAGYRTWLQIPAVDGGVCQVAKGQEGLMILAPMTARSVDVDEDTGDETVTRRLRGFRTVKVFHQGQLVSPPAFVDRMMPELLTGDDRWTHVSDAVTGRLEADGFTVARHTRLAGEEWNGRTSFTDRQVLIADDLEPPQALKTLCHEWGHVELDHEHRADTPRAIKEVEAESVAYLLAQTVNLDSGAYSVPYISGWAGGDLTKIRQAAEQILTTSKRLVEYLEADLGIDLAPDLINHTETRDTTPVHLHPTVPDPAPDTVVAQPVPDYEQPTLPGLAGNPPDAPASVVNIEQRRFLKAMIDDLEPAQRQQLAGLVYDPRHADTTAAILAESGKTASQIARLMQHLDFEISTIRDALLAPVPDLERPSLFGIADVRSALHDIDHTADLDDLAPLVQRPGADPEPTTPDSGAPMDDARLVQRAIRQHGDPARVAALAYGLDLEPATVINICRASGTQPSHAMAIAIAMRDGDARTAYHDITTTWPDVEGGWERHTHPSLRGTRHLTPVRPSDASREILDRWTGRKPARHLTHQPLEPN